MKANEHHQHVNTNVTIARVMCPKCHRVDISMRNNFTLHPHLPDDIHPGRRLCLGPGPEVMLTIMLREAGLDVRPDRDDPRLWDDPAWVAKQRAQDERDQARYWWRADKWRADK